MAISRYRNAEVIEGKYFDDSKFPTKQQLDAIPTIQVRASRFERLDILADRHLGDGTYWWVIALMNDIEWIFGFDEGQVLKIPVDIQDVLRLM